MDRKEIIKLAGKFIIDKSGGFDDRTTVEWMTDFALSLLQWRDVADGLPEVEGMYLFKRKGEAGSEAEQYWYNPNCSTAKKARICEEYQALFGPIPPYKEQR